MRGAEDEKGDAEGSKRRKGVAADQSRLVGASMPVNVEAETRSWPRIRPAAASGGEGAWIRVLFEASLRAGSKGGRAD